jgi:hypothetical protein
VPIFLLFNQKNSKFINQNQGISSDVTGPKYESLPMPQDLLDSVTKNQNNQKLHNFIHQVPTSTSPIKYQSNPSCNHIQIPEIFFFNFHKPPVA